MSLNRLLYVLVGAALGVGLLMSAFVRPESLLAAAQNCYGICPSATALSLSSPTITYGSEQAETFRAVVAAAPSGAGAPTGAADGSEADVPTGSVDVQSGGRTLCSVRLLRGMGDCSPSDTALPPGTHTIVARYSGDPNYTSSTSGMQTLTVLSPSLTALWLSHSAVAYGNEQAVSFRVIVSATSGASVPTGYVNVQSGGRTLCSIRLFRGMGNCSPGARAMSRGWQTIQARYSGDPNFASSASSPSSLLVY